MEFDIFLLAGGSLLLLLFRKVLSIKLGIKVVNFCLTLISTSKGYNTPFLVALWFSVSIQREKQMVIIIRKSLTIDY